jgi:hypothetical protein
VKMPAQFIAALDQRAERGQTAAWRWGTVTSVTGDYSSDHPLVELDDPNATEVQLVNYSAHTLAVGSKVSIAVQGDQWIVGKHPDSP